MTTLRAVRLAVTPEVAEIVVGSALTLSLTLQNVGSRADRYRLGVCGVPDAWFTVDKPVVSLLPGARERLQLAVCPPAGIEQALICSYSITTWVTSEDDSSIQAIAVVALTVVDGGLSIDVSPAEAEGQKATFHVTFFNQRERPAAIGLALTTDKAGLHVHVAPAQAVLVPAGGIRTVAVHVWPKDRAMIGDPSPYELEFRGLNVRFLHLGPGDETPLYLRRRARFTYMPHYAASSLLARASRLTLVLLEPVLRKLR